MNCLTRLVTLLLCICAFSCEAKDTKDLIHYQVYTPNAATVIHVLSVDPKAVKIVAMRAQDVGHGLDTVGNIARRAGALAAVNGGYFRLNTQQYTNAIPAGVLKINDIWHGIAYKPRGAIGWDPETNKVLFDIVQTDSQVILQDQHLPINAMNKEVQGDKAALFSDSYNAPVDVLNSIGVLILDKRVQAVYDSGQINIPADGYMYTLSGNLRTKVSAIQTGTTALINIRIKPQLNKANAKQWDRLPFVVGGGPLLIFNHKKIKNFTTERMQAEFINGHYARTAVGITANKKWLFVVADRSPLEGIAGLSIPELQDFMLSLGCVAAVNLDGGGSSTMYIEDVKYGSITDQPVGDALVILPKQ